jgi:uncharacterized protein DUF6457
VGWLDDMTEAVARAAEMEAPRLELSDDVRREILDLARIASHASGDRINAPLLCYALGIAVGRGATLDDLAAAVRSGAEGSATSS